MRAARAVTLALIAALVLGAVADRGASGSTVRFDSATTVSSSDAATVTIPLGGEQAPDLDVKVPVTRQSAATVAAAARKAAASAADVSVGGESSAPTIPSGFVGLSMEVSSVPPYAEAGSLFAQVLSNLAPGQRPVIRVGGDSTDHAWVPIAGEHNTGLWDYLNPPWIADAKQLAGATDARMAFGLNLEVNQVAVPALEAKTLWKDLGPNIVTGFELGNEPELYSAEVWYDFHNQPKYMRSDSWDAAQFVTQLNATVPSLGDVPTWGPEIGNTSSWWSSLPEIAAASGHLNTITDHAYPTNCYGPTADQVPDDANLLAPSGSTGLAEQAAPEIAFARDHRLAFRVDEINTVSCAGEKSLPDVASALWAAQTAFAFAKAGASGVNIHTFPTAAYRLFSFANHKVSVANEYYGWMLFARAAPPGSHLLNTTTADNASVVSLAARDGSTTNVVLVNDSTDHSATVSLSLPGTRLAAVEPLRATSQTAAGGVSFAGMKLSATTGRLSGHPAVAALSGAGHYSVWLPPESADLVTATG